VLSAKVLRKKHAIVLGLARCGGWRTIKLIFSFENRRIKQLTLVSTPALRPAAGDVAKMK
jgi:hypothetical protein